MQKFQGGYQLGVLQYSHKAMALNPSSSSLLEMAFEVGVDNTVYWFSSWTPSTEEKGHLVDSSAKLKEYVLGKLQNAPEMKKVVENTKLDSIKSSPLRYREPWEFLYKSLTRGNVCVAGDALHSMTPDLAQGGCAVLEDSIVLGWCVASALKRNSSLEEEEEECRRIELGLKKYAGERRWRSFELIVAGYLVGRVQESDGKITSLLRDHVLAKLIVGLLLKMAEFDCGKLTRK